MTCIKTGADIFLAEYGAVAHGDLFKYGSVYVFNNHGCTDWNYPKGRNPIANLTFYRAEKIGSMPVWVCEESNASNFEYEGGIVLL